MKIDFIYILQIIVAVFDLLLALYVFAKGNKNNKNIFYALNILAIIFWTIGLILFQSFSFVGDKLWITILYIAPTFTASTFLAFSYFFPTKDKRYSKTKIISIFIINLSLIILILIPDLIVIEGSVFDGIKGITLGPAYFLYVLYIFGFYTIAFTRIFLKHFQVNRIEKKQIKILLIGYMIAANAAFITNLFLPWIGNFYFNRFGPMFSSIMVAVVAIAIIRYRFMDIRVVIKRSSIYIITVVIALVIYAALIFLFQTEIFSNLNLNSTTATLILTALIIAGVPLIQKGIKTLTEKVFTKEEYDPQKALDKLEKITIDNQSQNVIEKAEEIIKKQLGVESVKTETKDFNNDLLTKYLNKRGESVIVKEELEFIQQRNSDLKEVLERLKLWFKYNQSDVGVILQNQQKIIGVVLLGPKENKKPYSVQDIEFLNQFQVRISIVLANTLLYESTINQLKK
ncbi:MAG: histidine kinase N-terminal 7TM domain-containing protein [bacterium]